MAQKLLNEEADMDGKKRCNKKQVIDLGKASVVTLGGGFFQVEASGRRPRSSKPC
jgi:hypothetical protein